MLAQPPDPIAPLGGFCVSATRPPPFRRPTSPQSACRTQALARRVGRPRFPQPDGSPLRGTKATQCLEAQLIRPGLPRIRFHDLRHSAATFLALSTAMAVLAHSTASTTLNIYTHVAPKLAREAAEALDRVLRGDVERL
jgi:integrase